ncbi:MAG: DUF5916 domain-containing protein [Flavobacteriales bacterium]
MKKLLLLLVLALAEIPVFSQNQETDSLPRLKISFTSQLITIDGKLNEKIWATVDSAYDFTQNFPYDTSLATSKTVVRMAYDNSNIYISAVCYDNLPDKPYVIQSLKRDFSYPVSDAFVATIDPFADLTNGFSFGVNPYGVQREGLVQGGGNQGVTTNWDNKWYSEVKRHNNKWVVEMAIPFKTLRFKAGSSLWRINFSRNDLKRNENSCWVRVPRNFNISTLAFSGNLIFDKPLHKPGTATAIIPYVAGIYTDDYLAGAETELKPTAGIDAKVTLSSSLNLDITVNPDFAQVEVDRQVTNLSRFSLFFPERRNFFIENSDLFERFGFRQIRPFFSRRIGLYNGKTVPIFGGLRLSGKINRNWRIGVMSMHTDSIPELGVLSENHTVAAFQYQLKGRSNIAGILVNRQTIGPGGFIFSDYNRVVGLDYNLASMNGKYTGKAFFHYSFSPEVTQNNYAFATWVYHSSQNWEWHWNHEYVGNNYMAQTGFVPRVEFYNPTTRTIERRSYTRYEPVISRKFYPKNSIINYHAPQLYLSEYLDSKYKTMERQAKVSYKLQFQNTAHLEVAANLNRVVLYFDTDITFSGNQFLPAGDYTFYNATLFYNTDLRKKLNATFNADIGQYYTGNKITYSADLNLRTQPWGIFSLSWQNNHISMPNPIDDVFFMLIGPRMELSFTRSLFLTTFVQYNTQAQNMNINTRFQWRFRPMSDLYLVYSENYLPENFSIKNRQLVLKFVYWLNI